MGHSDAAARPINAFFYLITGLVCLLLGISAQGQPIHAQLLYSHSLSSAGSENGITLQNTDGHFFKGGWEITTPTSQLFITLPDGLPLEATMSIQVTNFDPYEQNGDDLKHPIIDLYSRPVGNKDIYNTDGAWFHLITGIGYQSGNEGEAGFKLWAAPRGVASKVEEQFMQQATWDAGKTYEFTFTWSRTTLYFLVDGILQMQLPFAGQVEPFRYIFLGKDNLTWGYSAQPGPIFFDLRLYGPAMAKESPAAAANVRLYYVE